MIKRLIKWLKDKHIIHTWDEGKLQQIHDRLYGIDYGCPAQRIIYTCKKCSRKKYIFLNLSIPYKDRYNHELWK